MLETEKWVIPAFTGVFSPLLAFIEYLQYFISLFSKCPFLFLPPYAYADPDVMPNRGAIEAKGEALPYRPPPAGQVMSDNRM